MPIIPLRDLGRLGEDARRQIRAALDAEADTDPQPPSSAAIDILPVSTSKMHNIRTRIDGYTFDSLSEARRYGELKIEALAGSITDLQVHPRFGLDVNGVHICDYEADFSYYRGGLYCRRCQKLAIGHAALSGEEKADAGSSRHQDSRSVRGLMNGRERCALAYRSLCLFQSRIFGGV